MKQSTNMNKKNPGTQTAANNSMTVLFVIAGLIVLFIILFCAARGGKDTPMVEVTVKELTDSGMVVQSESGKLGTGEIRLAYADDLYVEDINGQEIDRAELQNSDEIRVSVEKEKLTGFMTVSKIILLPDDSDDYI